MPISFPRRKNASPLKSEWRIFLLLMLACAAVLGYVNGLGQPDRFIYDTLIKRMERPADERIVIVAIDKDSIAGLGRWPWNRTIHAGLLDILTQGKARAVGIDIIFSEPDLVSGSDMLLAQAISRNRHTVLPVLIERTTTGLQPTLPLPQLMDAAQAVGHTHFGFDADGVVRSVLLSETLDDASWPQFALAVYQAGMASPISASGARARIGARERIAFAGPPGHFHTVSYIDVLTGKIAPSFFEGKYVLVGANASGIATMFPTPVTTTSHVMSGAEINANILAGMLEEHGIHEARPWLNALFTVLFTCLALFACLYLSPFSALGATFLLLAAVGTSTYALLSAEIWLPPAAAALMVTTVYPLWNWRRLEATIFYLSEELARLNRETTIVLRHEAPAPATHDADFLDRQIAAMRVAADRSRDIHQFISDSLNNMPDATLVLSQSGELLMCNRMAEIYLASIGIDGNQTPSLAAIFSRLEPLPRSLVHGTDWYEALLHESATHTTEIETRDADGREFLLKSTASRTTDGAMLGWIVSLIDVTTLRAAERRREESLNFISHDLRVPQSSILALIQLQKNPATAFGMPEFLARIEKSVESTLHLAESFVHLAKAESPAYQLQDSDFCSMLAEAADTMWAFAHSRSVEVVIDAPAEHLWLTADRSLMIRAIGNLLSNAIKFSPEGERVHCRVEADAGVDGPRLRCSIRDHGPGIPSAKQTLIFSPFLRADDQGQDGIGLGLAFVKMVVERHGGTIEVDSTVGIGSTFTIVLPCAIEEEQDRSLIEKQEGSNP